MIFFFGTVVGLLDEGLLFTVDDVFVVAVVVVVMVDKVDVEAIPAEEVDVETVPA